MYRRVVALLLAFALLVGGGVLAWWIATPADELVGADLRARPSTGLAEVDPSGMPVVPRFAGDTAVDLDVRLCPGESGRLPADPPSALWTAPGRGDWQLARADLDWEPTGDGCLRVAVGQTAAELWPGVQRGVVRWAVVVGQGAAVPPSSELAGGEWRDRGLLVVDGEAIRVP